MKNIAIVGLGVIGGSFAKAIAENRPGEFRVLGIDTDPETLKVALENAWIHEGETQNESILQRADLVIFAIYPDAMKNFLAKHSQDFKEGSVLTDTAGVKKSYDAADLHLPPQADFIMGHPMAGRESRGLNYADAGVFKGANYLIAPTPDNKKENVDQLTDFLKSLGFKRITLTSPQVHDEMIAFTSQLCHAIAVSLINSDQNPKHTVAFIGDSYRDLTRIAKINEDLWTELFLENKDALLEVIGNFKEEFELMENYIASEDAEGLKSLFKEGKERRIQLEKDDQRLQRND